VLLDTDILIDLLRGNQDARDFLSSLPEDSPHCCSAITVAELHSGMREAERQKTTKLIDSLVILPVTRDIAEVAGKLRQVYGESGRFAAAGMAGRKTGVGDIPRKETDFVLELDDCLIAATAAVNGLELATRNPRHYPMPEVRLRAATY
jgi:predicted nucleic acid-binding protein